MSHQHQIQVDENAMGRESELVFSPGVYAYVLDQTKGFINTLTGPVERKRHVPCRGGEISGVGQTEISLSRTRCG
jgi:hypothetical protein